MGYLVDPCLGAIKKDRLPCVRVVEVSCLVFFVCFYLAFDSFNGQLIPLISSYSLVVIKDLSMLG